MKPNEKQSFIIGYIYGFLHNKWYQEKFNVLLMHHYPRVYIYPETSILRKISKLGLDLISEHIQISLFHLQKLQDLKDKPIRIVSSDIYSLKDVSLVTYEYNQTHQKLSLCYLNNETSVKLQFSISVSSEIWFYQIGSIKIIDHWLKSRKINKIERSWTLTEWKELELIVDICRSSHQISTQISEKIGRAHV